MRNELNVQVAVGDVDLAICRRLREIRLSLKWSQPSFATEFGLSRVRLASYEYGRAPVRYGFAKAVCEKFGINQRWFAEGLPPRFPYFAIAPDLEGIIPSDWRFSLAYHKFLRPHIESELDRIKKLTGKDFKELVPADVADMRRDYVGPTQLGSIGFFLSKRIEAALTELPPELHYEYYAAIVDASEAFEAKNDKEIKRFWKKRQ